MNVRLFMLVALFGSAVACSDSAATSASASCSRMVGSTSLCADYSNVSSANARSGCTSNGGSFSASACSSTNRIGRCVAPGNIGGTQTNSTLNFYVPTTDADARQVCAVVSGTYTSG